MHYITTFRAWLEDKCGRDTARSKTAKWLCTFDELPARPTRAEIFAIIDLHAGPDDWVYRRGIKQIWSEWLKVARRIGFDSDELYERPPKPKPKVVTCIAPKPRNLDVGLPFSRVNNRGKNW